MTEVQRLKIALENDIKDQESLERVFRSSDEIVNELETRGLSNQPTGLALGYVQSGKTTAMTALAAECADRGYQIVIAFLGVTNLLLGQNTSRIIDRLGIESRNDYRWVTVSNPKGPTAAKEIEDWVLKGRTVFIPVLKNAQRINAVADTLELIPSSAALNCLIIDDEADQASLNTLVRIGEESKVYASIDRLRSTLQCHGFVQFTATPYAPLLLEPTDPLFPEFVTFLEPGTGYTGGREFFMDHADTVIRYIPAGDEQGTKLPIELPKSLVSALWNFILGSAILDTSIEASRPISMLIHPSSRKDAQDRYQFLLTRKLDEMTNIVESATSIEELGEIAQSEYSRLVRNGVAMISLDELLRGMKYVLSEVKTWLLHSATAVKQVNWNISPFHILIGGNKLDRGFTVEGLTVTYMNRPSSDQVDTIEQRARAFGYRSEFLPYCQFFSSARTIKMLREIVVTEYDLRSRLLDAVESGQSIADWSKEIGLLLPEGAKPTRDNVVSGISHSTTGWRQWRRPIFDSNAIETNYELTHRLGLFEAPTVDYQRLQFRTLELDMSTAINFLTGWSFGSGVSRWEFDEWMKIVERQTPYQEKVKFILMEQDAGQPSARCRTRTALPEEGYVNLFQGRDLNYVPGGSHYPGDREIWPITDEPSNILVQVHRVMPKDLVNEKMLTLAIYLGDRGIFRKELRNV
jgi:hypothetical protein